MKNYRVEIGVTYKYVVDKVIRANSKKDARKRIANFLRNIDRRTLEHDWSWGDDPVWIGDAEILDIEETD